MADHAIRVLPAPANQQRRSACVPLVRVSEHREASRALEYVVTVRDGLVRLVHIAVRTLHQGVDLAVVVTDERHADAGYAANGGRGERTDDWVIPAIDANPSTAAVWAPAR